MDTGDFCIYLSQIIISLHVRFITFPEAFLTLSTHISRVFRYYLQQESVSKRIKTSQKYQR